MLKLIFNEFSQFSEYSSLIRDYLSDKGEKDEETYYNVRLAICELAGNIIRHSKSSATVMLRTDEKIIEISISGSRRFNYGKYCLPPCDKENGRGIYIVREISQELQYTDGGREVNVIIKRH